MHANKLSALSGHRLFNIAIAIAILVTATLAIAQNTPLPAGIPLGAAPDQSTQLKYRASDKPLTLGEIVDLQAKKANAELLARYGFTQQQPTRITRPSVETPKSSLVVLPLVVWSDKRGLQAEVMVNEALRKVRIGDAIAPGVTIKTILPAGLVFDVRRTVAKAAEKEVDVQNAEDSDGPSKRTKAKTVTMTTYTQRTVLVDQAVDLF